MIDATRSHSHQIRSLENFTCYENSIDKGAGVREKAKQVMELVGNLDLIRSERDKARVLRNKFVGISNEGRNSGFGGQYSGGGGGGGYDSHNDHRDRDREGASTGE